MSRLSRNPVTSLLFDSAVAGFGFSGGRSSWRWFEKHGTTLVVITLMIAGSGLAGFYLRSSDKEGFFRRLFLTWLPAIGIILISLFVCLALGSFIGSSDLIRKLFIWQGIAFVIGLIAAQPVRNDQRRARKFEAEAQSIKLANEMFLREAGIRAVGGRENTMIDELGREIVVDDARSDAILFRVKGRRGVRSKITLDADGRMVAYEPAADYRRRPALNGT